MVERLSFRFTLPIASLDPVIAAHGGSPRTDELVRGQAKKAWLRTEGNGAKIRGDGMIGAPGDQERIRHTRRTSTRTILRPFDKLRVVSRSTRLAALSTSKGMVEPQAQDR